MSRGIKAFVTRLPWRNGDGYSWGGEVVLNIGDRAFLICSTREDEALASAMADAWNRRAEEMQ